MRKSTIVILATLLVFATVFASSFIIGEGIAYGKAKYQIKISHSEPVRSVIDRATQKIKARVAARSRGEVELLLFPAGQLGKTAETAEMMQMGALQMAIGLGSPAHVSGVYTPLTVFDIPFLLPESLPVALEIINGRAGETLSAGLKKNNMRALAYYIIGSKQYTCNHPIQKPDDFKGLKIRVMASPILVEAFKSMGAIPVPIPFLETYTALQLGTVVGQENPIHTIEQMKFYEVQDYVILSEHQPFVILVYTNNRWFEGLPENIQKILSVSFKEIAHWVLEESVADDEKSLEHIEKSGTKVLKVTPENREAFRKALGPVRAKYIEMVGEEGRKVLKVFDEELSK